MSSLLHILSHRSLTQLAYICFIILAHPQKTTKQAIGHIIVFTFVVNRNHSLNVTGVDIFEEGSQRVCGITVFM